MIVGPQATHIHILTTKVLVKVYTYKLGRVLPFLVFFIICSCSPLSSKSWTFQQLDTGYPRYNGGRIFFQNHDALSGVELTIMRGSYGYKAYLDVFTRLLPASSNELLPVLIKKETKKVYFEGVIMQGRQRLSLSSECTDYILQTLEEGNPLTISLPNTPFVLNLRVANFSKVYKKLETIKVASETAP